MHTSVCRFECLQHSSPHPWSLSARQAKVQDTTILFHNIGTYLMEQSHEIEFKYFDKSGSSYLLIIGLNKNLYWLWIF